MHRRRWRGALALGGLVGLAVGLVTALMAGGADPEAAQSTDPGAVATARPMVAKVVQFSSDGQEVPEARVPQGPQAGGRHLAAPDPPRSKPRRTRPRRLSGWQALALYYRSEIWAGPAKKPRSIGYARRGERIRVRGTARGPGCKGGKWYRVAGGGYVCTRHGFQVSTGYRPLDLHHHLPDHSSALPFDYGKAKNGAIRLYRVPTPEEEQQIAAADVEGQDKWPEVVSKVMAGAFFLALARLEKDKERTFWRTVYGRYVRAEEVEPREPPRMRGERLRRGMRLPVAFVYGENRPLLCGEEDELRRCGAAEKHARFAIEGERTLGGQRLVWGPDDLAIDRRHVRVAYPVERPEDVGAKDKWIHVNLREQTLVAYEGNRPVFATLVSSGKEGFEPPTGLFRVHYKHVSVTMNGPDPDVGYYEVEEVPWTMYYWESYALHGAYWHDDFGKVRSHGCTNIAPADARWLFNWTGPTLPRGWHGLSSSSGTHVYFTDERTS